MGKAHLLLNTRPEQWRFCCLLGFGGVLSLGNYLRLVFLERLGGLLEGEFELLNLGAIVLVIGYSGE